MNDQALSVKAQTCMWTRANEVLGGDINGSLEEKPCIPSSGDLVGHDASRGPGLMTVKEIDSDHCSMFILRKHVELLGRILIEMVEA